MDSRSFNKNATRLENRFKRIELTMTLNAALAASTQQLMKDSCLNFLFLIVANRLATNQRCFGAHPESYILQA